jgi:hypothetical protein
MLHIASVQNNSGLFRNHAALRAPRWSALAIPLLLLGCKSTSSPSTAAKATPTQAAAYPARPTVPPPAFNLFHHANDAFTLVLKDSTTDDEVESLVWQLRDTARAHAFDKLKISQKEVDTGGSTVWFHIYRGTKCASEKYADGPPPCGGSYHAAGDYTLSKLKGNDWDNGTLRHGEAREIPLWDTEATYIAPTLETSTPK